MNFMIHIYNRVQFKIT